MKARALILGLVLLLTGGMRARAATEPPLGRRSLPDLLELMGHRNPVVRGEAALELGRRGNRKALLPLLEALSDRVPAVRAQVAEALRMLGDERAVPLLAKALADPDETVRCRAALALGDLADRYVVPALKRTLSDPACVVRAAAVRALGEIGDPLSLSAVIQAQKEEREDRDSAVTAAALIAAAKLGGVKGLAASLALAAPKLEASWLARCAVARAVAIAKDSSRAGFLAKLLARDEDPRVCQTAAAALGALGKFGALGHALSLPEPFRRRAAVAGLSGVGGKAVRPLLLRAARDEDPGVRLEAGAALLARGEVEAFPVVIDLLDTDPSVWLGAVEVLESRTGLAFGRNPPRWKEWFRGHRDRLRFRKGDGVFVIGK